MRQALFLLASITLLAACGDSEPDLSQLSRYEFATHYAAAWSSQDPEKLAWHYAEDGVLVINDGEPSRGREAIEATAETFMEDFPDMVIAVDKLVEEPNRVIFYWRWTGTNSGLGGTGNAIDMRGYEVWTINADGLITESLGVFDQDEYVRQLYGDDE